MATLTNGSRSKQQTRKRVTQPVLPALPLLPKKSLPKTTPSATPERSTTPPPQITPQRPDVEELDHDTSLENYENGTIIPGRELDASDSRPLDLPSSASQELPSKESPVTQDNPSKPDYIVQLEKHVQETPDHSTLQEAVDGPRLAPVTSEATTENVQSLGSQPYESNKVQEWADEVKDGSNESTWSAGKRSSSEVQLNGIIVSNHDEPARPSNAESDQENISPQEDPATINGDVEDHTKHNEDSQPVVADSKDPYTHQPDLPTITEHLIHLATTKNWADWVLMVNVNGLQSLATYAHSLVLVRSSRLQKLMQHERRTAFGSNVINLYPPREILPSALEAALRFLYSDNVVSEDYLFLKEATPSGVQARANSLNYILSYWIAAIELGLAPVAARAAQLLEGFVQWDLAALIMKEAEELSFNATPSNEERANAEPDYINLAKRLRQIVVRFISAQLDPESFTIVPTATASAASSLVRSRFSLLEDARLKHNPALASMVFGSMPSSAELPPASPQSEILPIVSSIEDQTASDILLNLDFADLEFFYKHLQRSQTPTAPKLVEDIVNEREHRRMKIISNRAVPNKQRIANSAAWDVAGFREYFQNGSLQRERVGFLLPTKTK